jgi:tRNA(Leu) C34 or U34 (ribose-2'-O)-methylase TrmL
LLVLVLLPLAAVAARLKRAGLDYWPHVCMKVHDSWEVRTAAAAATAAAVAATRWPAMEPA